ncbi:hypothetical protein [Streptomyces rubradiris]|uniref:Uncharacterized protein n=1 Tax=Streptomyces rubradiris TaxID=285531 RepID=A0ABQ3R3C3_STRRR|nr:hypothetical protein [Streptomyces rubradiris]GHH30001.1 hypothetical protein GCM10018792_75850 [Streptomyces rubradiris]GHI50366.1 hypothetical protein Srubr_02120 [Streptomyces rubradiris]
MPAPVNASDTDILALLRDGYSNLRISRELHVDKTRVARLRRKYDIPNVTLQPLTLEEKWATRTKLIDGGHLEWLGERAGATSTPVMRYKEASYSPAAIAFEKKHGRPPQGYVKAECEYPHCVAPDHVNDEAGRQEARRKVRAERGLGDLPTQCVRGHDQAEHGRLEPDGSAYCGMCKVLDKRAQRDPSMPRRIKPRATSLEEAFRLRAKPIDGGHVRWTGPITNTTPNLRYRGANHSAYRIAFRLHYGRVPEGQARPVCGVPGCLAGGHLEDRPMRQRTASLFNAIFGA